MILFEILPTFVLSILASCVVMTVAFFVSKHLHRCDVIDAFWGIACLIAGITAVIYWQNYTLPVLVSLGLVAVWAARLTYHLARRIRSTDADDRRYIELVSEWDSERPMLQVYTKIFLVQAFLAAVIMMPVIVMASVGTKGILGLTITGAVVWLIGFITESTADYQLSRFAKKQPGELMTSGIWRYSRHPNYFGEIVQWIGIGIIALGVPNGWFGLIGPLVITLLIVFVSGVPLAEKHVSKKPGWADYARRTSILIPKPPRVQESSSNSPA